MAASKRHEPPDYRLDQRYRHVERYLEQLARLLPGGCRDELVAEARRHLFDATGVGLAAGLPADAAQRDAIHAFGAAPRIALVAWRAHGFAGPPWADLRARLLGRGTNRRDGPGRTQGEMSA